jgi:hypothetical protein
MDWSALATLNSVANVRKSSKSPISRYCALRDTARTYIADAAFLPARSETLLRRLQYREALDVDNIRTTHSQFWLTELG